MAPHYNTTTKAADSRDVRTKKQFKPSFVAFLLKKNYFGSDDYRYPPLGDMVENTDFRPEMFSFRGRSYRYQPKIGRLTHPDGKVEYLIKGKHGDRWQHDSPNRRNLDLLASINNR